MTNTTQPSRRRPAAIGGGLAILAGLTVLALGLPDFSAPGFSQQKLAELKPGMADFPDLHSAFPVERLERRRLSQGESSVGLNIAHYQHNGPATAIIYPPAAATHSETALRHDLWQAAAEAIRQHADAQGLFLAWWDDAQRLRLLTGRDTWLDKPVASAYPDAAQREFWREAGGGFAPDETRSKQFARWLLMDADAALAEIRQALPPDRPAYWLVCLDVLARLSEIAALSGTPPPFEAKSFPAMGDLHGQIAAVQRWASEQGPGSYLVQQLPGGGARVWRINSEAGAKTLLARLLPFTSSLAKPLEPLSLVYQSPWGGYLSVYEWRR